MKVVDRHIINRTHTAVFMLVDHSREVAAMSLQGFGYDDVVNQFEKRYNFWRVWDELA
ncbi:MAG: hypothetical protein O4859_21230 [Trichodesmium sp. St18_bin1]|nr:hypothetical protein [Trichodesmium sp. St18_bin1]